MLDQFETIYGFDGFIEIFLIPHQLAAGWLIDVRGNMVTNQPIQNDTNHCAYIHSVLYFDPIR